jgi:hypothetical protein
MLKNIDLRKELLGIKNKYEKELNEISSEDDAIKFATKWKISSIYKTEIEKITVKNIDIPNYFVNPENIKIKVNEKFLYITNAILKEEYKNYIIRNSSFEVVDDIVKIKNIFLTKYIKIFDIKNFKYITNSQLNSVLFEICYNYGLKYPSCDKIQLFLDYSIDQKTFIKSCSESC